MCIGSSFASMEAVLVLATLAQHFKLRLTHPEDITPSPTITLRPKNGVKVRLGARVPAPASGCVSAWLLLLVILLEGSSCIL